MSPFKIKFLWNSTNERLPTADQEVLGFVFSPDLENLGYHIVTFEPETNSWHEVSGRRKILNITHWLPLEPPANILPEEHHKHSDGGRKAKAVNPKRRETDRNKEIMFRLLDGQTYQEVADIYDISATRVRNIALRVLQKLAPNMKFTLAGIRRIKELLKKQIDEEL